MTNPRLEVVNTFVIEKGVPMPEKEAGQKNAKYPLKRMEIGDSFFMGMPAKLNNLSAYLRVSGQRSGRKFSYRKVDGGVRVWRIA